MSRLARVVVPHCPHHVTQRGVRRMAVFLTDADRQDYLRRLLFARADRRAFPAERLPDDLANTFRRGTRIGRPLGDAAFIARLERLLGRPLLPKTPGRPRKDRGKRGGQG